MFKIPLLERLTFIFGRHAPPPPAEPPVLILAPLTEREMEIENLQPGDLAKMHMAAFLQSRPAPSAEAVEIFRKVCALQLGPLPMEMVLKKGQHALRLMCADNDVRPAGIGTSARSGAFRPLHLNA